MASDHGGDPLQPGGGFFALVKRSPRRQARRMKLLALGLAVLALGAPGAQARLGETEPELIQRFGDEEQRPAFFPGVRHLVFIKQGFVIDVGLIDGVSQLELYSLDHSRRHASIEPDQVKALLALESQGHSWTPVVNNQTDKWTRDDGAVAYFSNPDQTFSAETETYREREKDYHKAQQPSLDGF
jgi:hypothetical protein